MRPPLQKRKLPCSVFAYMYIYIVDLYIHVCSSSCLDYLGTSLFGKTNRNHRNTTRKYIYMQVSFGGAGQIASLRAFACLLGSTTNMIKSNKNVRKYKNLILARAYRQLHYRKARKVQYSILKTWRIYIHVPYLMEMRCNRKSFDKEFTNCARCKDKTMSWILSTSLPTYRRVESTMVKTPIECSCKVFVSQKVQENCRPRALTRIGKAIMQSIAWKFLGPVVI